MERCAREGNVLGVYSPDGKWQGDISSTQPDSATEAASPEEEMVKSLHVYYYIYRYKRVCYH
jgi:hypothetical protein